MGPLTEARAVLGPNEKRAEPSTPERPSNAIWMGSVMIIQVVSTEKEST